MIAVKTLIQTSESFIEGGTLTFDKDQISSYWESDVESVVGCLRLKGCQEFFYVYRSALKEVLYPPIKLKRKLK